MFYKTLVIMVNDIACQKQEATKQKCKPEVSEMNLLFFKKKSYIIYQFYKLKVPTLGLPLKWFTSIPYLRIDLDHTSAWHNG